MSCEIDPQSLRCNSCWNTIKSGKAYKTACNHLFCRACTEQQFSKKMSCPLCDCTDCESHQTCSTRTTHEYRTMQENVEGDSAIMEVSADLDSDTAVALFGFAAFHGEEALRILGEALAFSRAQTALYGTREIWIKHKETESVLRKLVDTENKVHSMVAELSAKAKETSDYADRLVQRQKELEEEKRRRKAAEDMYMKATGRSLTLSAMHSVAAQNTPRRNSLPGSLHMGQPPSHLASHYENARSMTPPHGAQSTMQLQKSGGMPFFPNRAVSPGPGQVRALSTPLGQGRGQSNDYYNRNITTPGIHMTTSSGKRLQMAHKPPNTPLLHGHAMNGQESASFANNRLFKTL